MTSRACRGSSLTLELGHALFGKTDTRATGQIPFSPPALSFDAASDVYGDAVQSIPLRSTASPEQIDDFFGA